MFTTSCFLLCIFWKSSNTVPISSNTHALDTFQIKLCSENSKVHIVSKQYGSVYLSCDIICCDLPHVTLLCFRSLHLHRHTGWLDTHTHTQQSLNRTVTMSLSLENVKETRSGCHANLSQAHCLAIPRLGADRPRPFSARFASVFRFCVSSLGEDPECRPEELGGGFDWWGDQRKRSVVAG